MILFLKIIMNNNISKTVSQTRPQFQYNINQSVKKLLKHSSVKLSANKA